MRQPYPASLIFHISQVSTQTLIRDGLWNSLTCIYVRCYVHCYETGQKRTCNAFRNSLSLDWSDGVNVIPTEHTGGTSHAVFKKQLEITYHIYIFFS